MAGLHVMGSLVTVVAAGLLAVAGGIAVAADSGHEAVRRLAGLVVAAFAVQGGLGFLLLLGGGRASDLLHVVYGVALVAVVPLALRFAAEAPGRARSGVLAVAALLALLLVWRLFATG